MSTATATQNDDLIILSDNISPTFGGEPIISENFSSTDNNSIISFDTPVMETSTKDDSSIFGENFIKQDELKQEDNGNVGSPIIIEEAKNEIILPSEPQIVQEETKELDSSINNLFGDLNFSNQTLPVETIDNNKISLVNDLVINSEEPVGDMNSILNTTIDKLKKRQTGISGQKSSKIATINELEAKIKELRDQVTYLKKEIVYLDDENIKIDINVGNLESMKTGRTSKTPIKTREHNTKKLVKSTKPV